MKKGKYSKYHEAVHYLESLNNIAGSYQKANLTAHPHPEMYLERMQDFLDRIGNPEKNFKYIHITGTSGKGSVSSLIHSTLVSQKKKAGLFTSPFVTSTIEKIVVGNKYIDPVVFAEIVEYLKPHIDSATLSDRHGIPSYFELILAIALLYFKKEKCEYLVLEVGLGGRYDATNIIKNPLVTAITNISLDHTQVLGDTKEKIAYDKAGIIKKGSHFFTTEENGALLSIFKNECLKVGAVYNALNVSGLDYLEKNRLLANTICKYLNVGEISAPAPLPARFEIVEKSPLVIIDGAHNVSKIETTLQNLGKLSYDKLSVVISISSDKDWESIIDILLPKIDALYVTKFSNTVRQCISPKAIIEFAKSKGFSPERIYLHNDPIQAFNKARKNTGKKDALLVVGSFYLAGDIRALYCPEEQTLKQRSSKI